MKNIRAQLLVFSFIFLSTINLLAQDSSETNNYSGDLIVRLIGFSSDEGKAMLAIFNDEESYDTLEKYKAAIIDIKDGVAEYIFENIPFGIYAAKCYHDENENGELDTNFLGIPTEDYGFSNNADGTFGPPDFEEAMFEFKTNQLVIKINID